MKKIFILILLATVGCNNSDKKIGIKDQTINELSSFNFNLPSPDIALFLFIKASDGKIARLNIITLHDIYTLVYSKNGTDFFTFLSRALNETIVINSEILKKKEAVEFTIDAKTMESYNDLSLFKFQSKYCDLISSGRFAIKKQYQNAKNLNTILYYFFINNYKVLPDDYLGDYIVVPPR